MTWRQTDVKMFVAAHTPDDALVVWASDEVLEDIKESSPYIGDLFAYGKDRAPAVGLWVWEGVQNWTVIELEADIDYVGKWRKPTGAEMLRAAQGQNPFNGANPCPPRRNDG